MYEHPWCIALLALTQIIKECERNSDSAEVFAVEGIEITDLIVIRNALIDICDVLFI